MPLKQVADVHVEWQPSVIFRRDRLDYAEIPHLDAAIALRYSGVCLGQQAAMEQLECLGSALRAQPVWREGFVTDNGNHILDVHNLQITNPLDLETRLNQIPGVIAAGLFAQRPADMLLVAEESGVRQIGG